MRAALERIYNRLLLLVGRAVVRAWREEGGRGWAQGTLLAGEEADGLEAFQEFGFASRPQAGAEAVVIFQGGNRAHGYVVGTEDPRWRPQGLQPGEVVIYNAADRLGLTEALPDKPDGAPEDWPETPEGWLEELAPEGEIGPPLCRIQITPERRVKIICKNLDLWALERIRMLAPSIVVGPPGAPTELVGG